MNLVINIVFKAETATSVMEHLQNRFPKEEFFATEFMPGMVYLVHKTETANQEIINETYRIADMIYERNDKEKNADSCLLRGVVSRSPKQLQLWEHQVEPNENQAEISECTHPLS